MANTEYSYLALKNDKLPLSCCGCCSITIGLLSGVLLRRPETSMSITLIVIVRNARIFNQPDH